MKKENNFKDISEQRFGMLKAIECIGSNPDGKALWKCLCDCGGECVATGKALRSGSKTNCGCIKGHSVDLIGQRFGNLTVIERDLETEDKHHSVYWKCKCDCGNIKVAKTANLRNGSIVSCGCIRKNNLVGKTFGRWKVIDKAEKIGRIQMYLCKCECGNYGKVAHSNLTRGKSTSCGCFQKEDASKRFSTHGMRNTRLYDIYANMKDRCYNQNNSHYASYGGRGISACKEWLGENGFINFYNWAIANGYQENLTIDRIAVNGNYEPSNCRWATQEQQSNNTRRTVWVEICGEKKSLKQWTNFMGWKYGRYSARYRRGVDIFSEEELEQIKKKIRKE